MQRIGDDSAGFSVDQPAAGEVVVKGWGFWNADVAAAFAPTVTEACLRQPRGGSLTLDMSDIKPMRDEGQQSFSRLLASLPKLGVGKVAVVTTNPLTKLQLVRLATESRTTMAIDWLAGTNPTGRDG